uniref:Uncharacterized protein n=1 Tax=Siphoviridae sp. ctmYS12 TaxID=2825652 RepID=A0A8S5P790_9CAUD|nr:MAG TPA: hypothetical protein [Siphoviridae sp. ctmYS12]
MRKLQRLESSRDNEPCITDKKMAGQACLKPVIFLSVYIGRMPETDSKRSAEEVARRMISCLFFILSIL